MNLKMTNKQINENKNERDQLIGSLSKFEIPYKLSDEGILMADVFSKQEDSSELPSYYIIKNTKPKIFII